MRLLHVLTSGLSQQRRIVRHCDAQGQGSFLLLPLVSYQTRGATRACARVRAPAFLHRPGSSLEDAFACVMRESFQDAKIVVSVARLRRLAPVLRVLRATRQLRLRAQDHHIRALVSWWRGLIGAQDVRRCGQTQEAKALRSEAKRTEFACARSCLAFPIATSLESVWPRDLHAGRPRPEWRGL